MITTLRNADLDDAARILDVDVAAIMAVDEVESRGRGFTDDGNPVVLFERHVMYRQCAAAGLDAEDLARRYPALVNRQRGGYLGGAREWARLTQARLIAAAPAIESASWGRYQIMGRHWRVLGFADAAEFAAAMSRSEQDQLAAFVRFIELDRVLHQALKAHRWVDFARRYNGQAYATNAYDTKLAAAHVKYAAKAASGDVPA